MKIAKEIKVGFLGIISLVVLYFGFKFLKGMDVFSSENEYTVVFKEVQGLQVSNAVTYKGVNVGRVVEMKTDQANDRIRITLAVNKNIIITDSTTAYLADDGLIGGKLIKMDIRKGNQLKEGSEITGGIELGLADAAIEKITPALNDVDSLVVSLTKVVRQFDQTGYALKALMENAQKTTTGVNSLMANNSKSIGEVTANAALLTNNLNTLALSLDQQIKPILSKTSSLTDSLQAMQLNRTVNELNRSIAGLQGILGDVNDGKGTLGKLTQDDSLYVNLDRTAASLDALLGDMKNNPRRYVHFSLFGGKDRSVKK